MLEAVLRHLNNWFLIDNGIHSGTYTIQGGSITLPFLVSGQYFRICGSVFNDGVYQYGDVMNLTEETFDGTVWALAVPKAMLALAEEISVWQEKNGEAGPYTSESFGGYSYTRATNSQTGQAAGWQDVFRSRLNPWRKMGNLDVVQPTRPSPPPYYKPYNPDYPWR